MKIEFDSIEELTSFIKTFKMGDPGTVSPESIKDLVTFRPELPAEFETKALETKKLDPVVEIAKLKEIIKEDVPEVQAAVLKVAEAPGIENITKEMLRERVTAIMSAGKGEEIRALISQAGYTSIPSIDVKDYPAIYEAAKGLL